MFGSRNYWNSCPYDPAEYLYQYHPRRRCSAPQPTPARKNFYNYIPAHSFADHGEEEEEEEPVQRSVPAPKCEVDRVNAAMPKCEDDRVKAAAPACEGGPVNAVAPTCEVSPVNRAAPTYEVDPVNASASTSEVNPMNTAAPTCEAGPVNAAAPTYEIDRVNAAVRVQNATRGFLVRKNVKALRELEREVTKIEYEIARKESWNNREKLRLNEMLMRILFRLDSVRGARDYRRKVVRKAIRIQDALDDLRCRF